jgi:transcriptional regulator with XRE-family HTH domain
METVHGNLLRKTMWRLRLDAKGMAKYLGVSNGTMMSWLKGERNPSDSAIRLIEVMGLIEIISPEIHALLLPPVSEPSAQKRAREAAQKYVS